MSRIRRIARKAGNRLKAAGRRMLGLPAGPAILMYHRVNEPGYDPWELAVTPARFDEQLAWLKRRRTVLPLVDIPNLAAVSIADLLSFTVLTPCSLAMATMRASWASISASDPFSNRSGMSKTAISETVSARNRARPVMRSISRNWRTITAPRDASREVRTA